MTTVAPGAKPLGLRGSRRSPRHRARGPGSRGATAGCPSRPRSRPGVGSSGASARVERGDHQDVAGLGVGVRDPPLRASASGADAVTPPDPAGCSAMTEPSRTDPEHRRERRWRAPPRRGSTATQVAPGDGGELVEGEVGDVADISACRAAQAVGRARCAARADSSCSPAHAQPERFARTSVAVCRGPAAPRGAPPDRRSWAGPRPGSTGHLATISSSVRPAMRPSLTAASAWLAAVPPSSRSSWAASISWPWIATRCWRTLPRIRRRSSSSSSASGGMAARCSSTAAMTSAARAGKVVRSRPVLHAAANRRSSGRGSIRASPRRRRTSTDVEIHGHPAVDVDDDRGSTHHPARGRAHEHHGLGDGAAHAAGSTGPARARTAGRGNVSARGPAPRRGPSAVWPTAVTGRDWSSHSRLDGVDRPLDVLRLAEGGRCSCLQLGQAAARPSVERGIWDHRRR